MPTAPAGMFSVKAVAATRTPVRVCVALLNRGEACPIHRHRPDGDQHSLPGGLLQQGEDPLAALARELNEELALDTTGLPAPRLIGVQKQATTRPGSDTLFRRLHLIHALNLPDYLRDRVATAEQDAADANRVLWLPLGESAELHLYPAAGALLAHLASGTPATAVELPPMDDRTYNWR
ncbi:NUDIX hydrolase [Kitasatospora cineracea]|uniref:NUDIX hydrolase n=1 Tax=Kitasatospora cineracea TaxID=88074 RepID=UPI0036DD20B2